MTNPLAAFAVCACGHAAELHHWSAYGGRGSCSRCKCADFRIPWPEQSNDGQLCVIDQGARQGGRR